VRGRSGGGHAQGTGSHRRLHFRAGSIYAFFDPFLTFLQNQLVAATGWKDAQKSKPLIQRFAGVDDAAPRRDARGGAIAVEGLDSDARGRALTAAGYLQSLKEHREWVSEEAQSMKERAKRAKAGEDFASMQGDSRLPKVNPLQLLDDDDKSAEGMLKKKYSNPEP